MCELVWPSWDPLKHLTLLSLPKMAAALCRVQQAVDWLCGLVRQVACHVDEATVTLARHILIEPTPSGQAAVNLPII